MQISRRKRLVGVALAAGLGLSMAACSGSDDDKATTFQIAVNTDGGHQAWSDAVTNQLKNNLGIDASTKGYPTFDELRTDVVDRTIKTAFRTGWQPDYPSIYNYLQPLYFTKAGSNDGDYSSQEFDDLITKVAGTQDDDEAHKLLADAQAVLMQDLPAIPLWYSNVAAAASKGVSKVDITWQNIPDYAGITKTDNSVVTVNGSEPQNPLVPTSTNETGGGNVIDNLWEGLVRYENDGTAVNAVAKSITSDDNITWTVTLKDGQKFSDGSPVTSESFVNAWNYGAVGANKQLNSYFFYPIKGFDEAQADEAKDLSGLKVVDDKTFTIELNQAEASFPDRLGYSAFFPVPVDAYKKLDAYGKAPIGNGPFKLAGKDAWQNDVQIALVPNDKYQGDTKVANKGVTFKFYTQLDAAYTDVQAGNLDVLDTVPDSALATFQDDDKIKAISQPGSVFQSFTIPSTLEHFKNDEEGRLRRQAISLAINREAITDKIFNKTRTPAKDFSSPVMPGFTEDVAGNEVLQYDPEKAKDLWEQANEINEW